VEKLLSKVSLGIIIAAFFILCRTGSADAANVTKTLDENTKITPPGVIVTTWDEIPRFRKGTVVTLNEYGEVLEGTLDENISLPYESGKAQVSNNTSAMAFTPPPFYMFSYNKETVLKYRVLSFKGGTKVVFNNRGEVIKGTINTSSECINLNQTNHIFVTKEISFNKNGMPVTCTLAAASFLRPVGWSEILTANYTNNSICSGLVEFKSGSSIVLNDKGEVVKGTLNKDTNLLSVGTFNITAPKLFEANTTVEFDDKGIVIKASKE
jgi:hypothetical protein